MGRIAAGDVQEVAVSAAGKILSDVDVAPSGMEYTDFGPFPLITGAAVAYTPWVNVEGFKGFGWYVTNNGPVGVSNTYAEWAKGLGGTGVKGGVGVAIAQVIAVNATEYSSEPTSTGHWRHPTEWFPLFCRSIRLGVYAAALVTNVSVEGILAKW